MAARNRSPFHHADGFLIVFTEKDRANLQAPVRDLLKPFLRMRPQLLQHLRRILDRERTFGRLPADYIRHDKYGPGSIPVL
jgi:hypothetical protein